MCMQLRRSSSIIRSSHHLYGRFKWPIVMIIAIIRSMILHERKKEKVKLATRKRTYFWLHFTITCIASSYTHVHTDISFQKSDDDFFWKKNLKNWKISMFIHTSFWNMRERNYAYYTQLYHHISIDRDLQKN